MKKTTILLTAITIIILILIYIAFKTESKSTLKCHEDSDCAISNYDCCGCEKGGKVIAINNKYKEKWDKNINCENINCQGKNFTEEPSCYSDSKCIKNLCTLQINWSTICDSQFYSKCQNLSAEELAKTNTDKISCLDVLDKCN